MTSRLTIWVVIVCAGVLTFAARGSFLLIAGRLENLPEAARQVLRMIPAAALAALVAPTILRDDGSVALLGPRALAGAVALIVAFRFNNILLTIVVGLAAVVAFSAVMA